uniref:2-isopropylmalate synthase n=1 Tax=Hemiselmis tepida TaxID=464990 RepID=A0A7S0VM37_9CRYP|mmetsp:Transcript_16365/g.41451  ORF Transcript_16365/g.41451 Transcript_16365/m.41451 type:complete len:648 (+) Transcript_16365:106-2049(+)|eukprot:CAMPEP_0174927588 /NCGR_PEP_ID=MMETSP1355-20121228/19000_1 /TAXON_ID=464990 /ORGANISM="Hemiselmis tepida, Strain CCMP443" /LENGTH=647 /DNA_ID=CAMNT_0016173699 /DNA_START=106 /DNA_END=2049 /DNA_ORIENTATION=-
MPRFANSPTARGGATAFMAVFSAMIAATAAFSGFAPSPIVSLRSGSAISAAGRFSAPLVGPSLSSRRSALRQTASRMAAGPKPVCVEPTKHDLATGRDPARIKVFDTTLRDGEQSPGCSMTSEEKMQVAKQLAKLGVDVIEAGFPIASNDDFAAVNAIATVVGNQENPPIICGLARATKGDIEACAKAISPAAFPRIHTFIATSDIHMEHKLKKTREEVLAITAEMVSYAKSFVDDVEFSAEDALRSDWAFLAEVYSVAVKAGATTLNVPDTVGYTTPAEFKALVEYLREHVEGIEGVTISVHGHNDLGMAVSNFLSAIEGGARQVEVTINGIGERAGNAALEEVVMGLYVRKNYYNERLGRPADSEAELTNINKKEIHRSSKLVTALTGMPVQPNKAIVGANAFAHESGIHQDGMLKNKLTYEIVDASTIGLEKNDGIVLGKHSGRAAFRSRLTELGIELSDDELNKAFVRFKEVADKKKEITNMDIESIVGDEAQDTTLDRFKLKHVQVQCGDKAIATATVTLMDSQEDVEVTDAATGTGPVDAAFQAVNRLCGLSGAGQACAEQVKLMEYSVTSVTAGIDALGEVTVRLADVKSGRTFYGRASETDVVVASTAAYVHALNRLLVQRSDLQPKLHPQMAMAAKAV